jgi:hypothetical protein
VTINDLGALGSFFASIAVFITLVYLARQVHQGNILHRMQSRESLMNQDVLTLQLQLADLDISKSFYKEVLNEDDLLKQHLFLTLFLRQREWEWLLHKDGVLPKEVYETYLEVFPIFLGTERTRKWWNSLGKAALNRDFSAEIDKLLEDRPLTSYWSTFEQMTKSGRV